MYVATLLSSAKVTTFLMKSDYFDVGQSYSSLRSSGTPTTRAVDEVDNVGSFNQCLVTEVRFCIYWAFGFNNVAHIAWCIAFQDLENMILVDLKELLRLLETPFSDQRRSAMRYGDFLRSGLKSS